MNNYKKGVSFLTGVLLVTITLLGGGCQERGVDTRSIIARVGEKEITRADFADMFDRLILGGSSEITDEELKDLKLDILNQIIEEELLLQEASRLGHNVNDEELSTEIALIKGEYFDDNFDATVINRYGSIERWKEEVKKKLIIKKVIDNVVNRRIKVTEEEALTFYKAHNKEYQAPEQVKARMIVVKTEEEARGASKRLKKENFANVAKEVSIGPEGEEGGNLGYFGKGDMPREFGDIVFSLPVGRISDVVKTPYGYHIFMVEAKRNAKKLNFTEVKDRIIARVEEEKREADFRRWIRELKKNAVIEIKEDLL
jgi:parvulin-like peptidyl-prolyl isomerase